MKWCLFSWHIYFGWVNKWWGRDPAMSLLCPGRALHGSTPLLGNSVCEYSTVSSAMQTFPAAIPKKRQLCQKYTCGL